MTSDCYGSAAMIWKRLSVFQESLYGRKISKMFSEETFSYESLCRYIDSVMSNSFHLQVDDGEVLYQNIRSSDASCCRILILNLAASESEAESWISDLLLEKCFVQARIYDAKYNLIQNATDLDFYKSHGLSYEHLPIISNGLPFPLERKIVDVSENPGRHICRVGYIETVGSVMWLGDMFWEVTGRNKDDVVNQGWLEVKLFDNYIKIKVREHVFDSASGEQGDLQNHLRALLFGTTQ